MCVGVCVGVCVYVLECEDISLCVSRLFMYAVAYELAIS